MRKEQPDLTDRNQPALIVVYGVAKRKRRPLRGDLVVIGRSPSCDIGVVSPEVAPVHCVLARLADGWHIRDCSGRATHLNGRAIHDEPLRNGDNIQIGAFSFEADLPPGPPAPAVAAKPVALAPVPPVTSQRQEHVQRSRKRFAERALRLRRRVREQAAAELELLRRQADLELLERRLRAAHQAGPAKGEKSDADQHALTQARAVLETEHARLVTRAAELDHFARHVRRHEQRLREQESDIARQAELDRAGFEADLVRQRVELERDHRELREMREAMKQRQADLETTVAQIEEMVQGERDQVQRERELLVRDQEYIEQQHKDLLQQRLALERLKTETPSPQPNRPPSTSETWHDAAPDRLESARRLLRELAERRKAIDQAARGASPE